MKTINRPALALVLSAPAALMAANFDGPDGHKFEITGFSKHEFSRSAAGARTVANEASVYSFDSRNAQSKPSMAQTSRADRNSELSMQQLTLGWSHESAGAVGIEAKLTYRWRGDEVARFFKSPDVDYREDGSGLLSRDFTERFVGISRPDLGSLKLGTQLSRSWSRSDAFSFPIGLSGVWADSGAGFGIFPTAVRLTSPVWEDGSGKLSVELTAASNERNTFMVDQARKDSSGRAFSPNPTKPSALELFFQFSNAKNLVELTVQTAKGAKQSAFGKSALVGWIGDPDTLPSDNSTPRRANVPSQSVVVLQGNHWPNPQNMFTWGARRSQWSGSAASCNYSAALSTCLFGLDPGFNYGPSSAAYQGYKATAYDAMLGWSHYRGLYTYTVGGVYFPQASSKNPQEWGQSNSALHLNLGAARKVPEISKGLTVTAGVARAQFQKTGPAPVSMPNNGFLGVNPLYDRVGHSATVGLTWTF